MIPKNEELFTKISSDDKKTMEEREERLKKEKASFDDSRARMYAQMHKED